MRSLPLYGDQLGGGGGNGWAMNVVTEIIRLGLPVGSVDGDVVVPVREVLVVKTHVFFEINKTGSFCRKER